MRRIAKPLALASLVFFLVACVCTGGEGPGPLNQAIRQYLDHLGVTTNGVYTPSGGTTPTLAEVLAEGADAGNVNITGVNQLFGGGETPATLASSEDIESRFLANANGTATIDATDVALTALDEITITAPSMTTIDGPFTTLESATVSGDLVVVGNMVSDLRVDSVTNGVGDPYVIIESQSGGRFNNSGTTVKSALKLPDAPTAGMHYFFDCVDSDGLRVVANTGDTIRFCDQTSASAGYFETVRVGSSVHLVAVSSTAWVAVEGIVGTWRADSTTSAGYAFTPTPWTAYTLAHTWDADADVSEADAYYMQSGREIRQRGRIAFTGAPPNTALEITIAGGYTSITTVGEGGSGSYTPGIVSIYDAGVGVLQNRAVPMVASNYTAVVIRGGTAGAAIAAFSATAPITWANGDYIYFDFTVPVQ